MPKAPPQTNHLLGSNNHLAADPTDCQVEDLLVAAGAADARFSAEGFEGGGGALGEPAEGAEEAWGRGHGENGGAELRSAVRWMERGGSSAKLERPRRRRVLLGV
ncbi:hypothetical protein V501_05915 [Pseudogymnoascus sp. VKM F-4519 (FW-2642)]|nr:hypothetical protein V501_05915 [Pseudogymnoascus sp. VKM F-4519 (FW-2642)]